MIAIPPIEGFSVGSETDGVVNPDQGARPESARVRSEYSGVRAQPLRFLSDPDLALSKPRAPGGLAKPAKISENGGRNENARLPGSRRRALTWWAVLVRYRTEGSPSRTNFKPSQLPRWEYCSTTWGLAPRGPTCRSGTCHRDSTSRPSEWSALGRGMSSSASASAGCCAITSGRRRESVNAACRCRHRAGVQALRRRGQCTRRRLRSSLPPAFGLLCLGSNLARECASSPHGVRTCPSFNRPHRRLTRGTPFERLSRETALPTCAAPVRQSDGGTGRHTRRNASGRDTGSCVPAGRPPS